MKRTLLLVTTTLLVLSLLAPASGPRAVQAAPLPQTGETTYTTYIPALFSKVPQWGNFHNRLALGNNYTCALTSTGGVKCWGENRYGVLGGYAKGSSSQPVNVPGLDWGYISLSAGLYYNCTLSADGGVKCWGYNYYGQLGDGTREDRGEPMDVLGLRSGVNAISAGVEHTCALMSGGGVKCWGRGDFGQLGDGSMDDHWSPVDVAGLNGPAIAISAGWTSTCALMLTGGVKCWGLSQPRNNSENFFTATPVDVPGFTSAVRFLAQRSNYSLCAVVQNGSIKCFPENPKITAELTGPNANTAMFSNLEGHGCLVTFGGAAKCWGMNWYGMLGDGSTTQSDIPVNVAGLTSGVLEIGTGFDHTCAITTDGRVKCWGYNFYGQLGNGTNQINKFPVDVVNFQ